MGKKRDRQKDRHAEEIKQLEHIVDLYNRRVADLEALVALKDKRILELQAHVIYPTLPPAVSPMIPQTVPFMQPFQQPIIVTCQHEYPENWGGTCPPSCKKCGQPAQFIGPQWVTCQSSDGKTSVSITTFSTEKGWVTETIDPSNIPSIFSSQPIQSWLNPVQNLNATG